MIAVCLCAPCAKAEANLEELESSAVTDPQLEQKLFELSQQINTRSKTLDLKSAMVEGLSNNPTLEKAYRDIQASEWDKVSKMRGWIPTLSFYGQPAYGLYSSTTGVRYVNPPKTPTATSTTSTTGDQSAVSGSTTTSTTTSTSLDNPTTTYNNYMYISPYGFLQWTFFDMQRKSNINSAQNTIEAKKFIFNSSARNLILEIYEQYYDLQATKSLIKQYQGILDITRRAVTVVNAQRIAGLKDYGDTSQVATQYYTALNTLIGAQNDLINKGSQLAKSLGYNDETIVLPNEELSTSGEWKLSLEKSLELGKNQNEEILSAISNAEASQWTSIGLKQSYVPTLYLWAIGYYFRSNGMSSAYVNRSPASPYNQINSNYIGQLGIGFTWSFDGGVNLANAQVSKKEMEAYLADAKAQTNSVVQNIKAAFGLYKTKTIEIKSASRGLKAAKLSQDVSSAKYKLGLSDITTLVQSIQLYSNAVKEHVNAISAYNKSIALLYRWSAIWPNEALLALQSREETLK